VDEGGGDRRRLGRSGSRRRAVPAGVGVTVFEAARQLGGRARSVSAHGQRLDNGQHILVGAYRETLRLMKVVGNDPDRLLKRMPLEIAFPGRQPAPFRLRLPRLPAPWHLAAGLLGTRGVSFAEKIGAVRFMRFLQSHGYRLDDDCTVSCPARSPSPARPAAPAICGSRSVWPH
jgi:uncharacterized protein with NAD-binding domain and iron-sulfur cluster